MDMSENLDALAKEAGAIDEAPAVAAQQTEQAQAAQSIADNAAQLMAAAVMIRAMWLPLLPARKAATLAQVWNDGTLGQASQAGAAVLDLHGVQMGEVLGRYGPYIALVASLGPPVLATVQIMKEPEPKPADEVKPAQVGEGASVHVS